MAKASSEFRLIPQTVLRPTPELDSTQLKAVAHRNSPLILRGATGTGKSTVALECAIARAREGAPLDSILYITFGRDTAAEIRDSIVAAIDGTVNEPVSRTFHSLAFSILSHSFTESQVETVLISGAEQESLIRDLLAADIEKGNIDWPTDLHFTDEKLGNPLHTQGFIRELRDLMMRATERKLTPAKLAEMGQRLGEKYWQAASNFWLRYLKTTSLMSGGAGDSKLSIDPSELMTTATNLLKESPDLRNKFAAQFRTIIVDEFHESDPGQREFLAQLAGPDLILVVDPTVAVGRFRGADPDGVDEWIRENIENATTITLEKVFRPTPQKSARQFLSANEEAQYIAHSIKRAHLIEGVAYSEMAVIVRSHGATASAIRRALGQSAIPVAGEREVITANAAVAPYLLAARIATGMPLTYEAAEQLLTAEFGGATSLSLRRTRTALLQARPEGDTRSGAELIIDAIKTGDINIEDSSELLRIHNLLSVAKKAIARKNATIHDLLNALWTNSVNSEGQPIPQLWQEIALRGGARGAAADRDLDAMIQLFDSAARHMDRFPNSNPQRFLDEISDEDIASDVIAYKGIRPDVVEIMTIHSAKGREFKRVYVAGLQEGSWPNLKQRSSLLGAERLVERIRHGEEIGDLPLRTITAESLYKDEYRLFHLAITRASEEVHLTAFSHEEDMPSTFFIDAYESQGFELSKAAPARPMTANALVADLRRALTGPDAATAATLLSTLGQRGISIAQPEHWTGALPISTTAPLSQDGETTQLSPSAADSFEKCELKWLLEKNGGTNGDSSRALLGSVIHEYARLAVEDPTATEEKLAEQLVAMWPTISDTRGWIDRSAYEKARTLLKRFYEYQASTSQKVLGVELDFEFTLGATRIKGSIDRIEITGEGKYTVIDFKTGKAISDKDAKKNLQLACYQLAVILNKLEEQLPDNPQIERSQLVYLGATAAKTESMNRYRDPIDVELVSQELQEIAARMGGATFMAKKNVFCQKCPVKSSCPLYYEGATVIG